MSLTFALCVLLDGRQGTGCHHDSRIESVTLCVLPDGRQGAGCHHDSRIEIRRKKSHRVPPPCPLQAPCHHWQHHPDGVRDHAHVGAWPNQGGTISRFRLMVINGGVVH